MNTKTHDHKEHGGSIKTYALGLALCCLLSALPFYWVMTAETPSMGLILAIMAMALIQIMVQLVFFLHLLEAGQQWTVMALVFTLVILIIVVGGSLWIMHDLNANMMSF